VRRLLLEDAAQREVQELAGQGTGQEQQQQQAQQQEQAGSSTGHEGHRPHRRLFLIATYGIGKERLLTGQPAQLVGAEG